MILNVGLDAQATDSETEQTPAATVEAPEQQPKAESRVPSAKKKKKAKQKSKKANASTAAPKSAKSGVKQQQPASQPEDDIDQLLASLNIAQPSAPEASTSGRSTAKACIEGPALLGVNPAKLKADDEMRRIFGSKVVDAEAKNDQAGGMVGASRRVRR